MTEEEALAAWWDAVYGGPLPTRAYALQLVMNGGVDAGTGGFLYVRLGELELP